jgi:hypothetical protein
VLLERQEQARRSVDDLRKSYEEFGLAARTALEDNLGSGLANAIKHTGTLRDVFNGLVSDLIDAGSRMVSHNIVQGLFGDFMTTQSNGRPGALGGLFGGAVSGVGHLFGFADGAIVTGGRGGVLARVGEGNKDELVAPLDKDGGLPVKVVGGQGGMRPQVKVYNLSYGSEQDAQRAAGQISAMEPDAVVNIIARDIRQGGPVARAMRRS